MSLEELVHLRMAHTPIAKLASMSRLVNGLPCHLQFSKVLRLPCYCCQEAKAKRPNYPHATTTCAENEDDLMTWDLIDMGEDWKTMRDNRYVLIFIIKKSLFAISILHKGRHDIQSVLLRAFAKAGFTPKKLRSDGAGEYISEELQAFFDERGIEHEVSNPHQQYQNAMSEKFVDTLGKGTRTLLLQSGLPPEFWGTSVLYFTDVYNHIPHASLNGMIQYQVHHQITPDVSWFRPYGCKATVFRGRDLVEHHKLAPRGESGIFIGLGMAHGRRGWLIYCPRLARIFFTREATFDETLFPLKPQDQRVYGIYDNRAVNQLRADAFGTDTDADTSVASDVFRMPMPAEPTSDTVEIYSSHTHPNDLSRAQEQNDSLSDDEDPDGEDFEQCPTAARGGTDVPPPIDHR
mmetsp:Transcript_62060/g.128459  ORF Transcript_62060/g.128459 Transcript_62060/m.128459 type:complete len:405 (-) Transcript_62060:2033-3247(-)